MVSKIQKLAVCCPEKPSLEQRPLLSPVQAGGLAEIFKVLANDSSICLSKICEATCVN